MPYTQVILGTRYQTRLEDLAATECLFARCLGCSRTWRIAPDHLHDRFPSYERLLEISRKRKCPCGATGDAITWHALRASVAG